MIQEESDIASKELSLEKALDKMLADWKPIAFECVGYRDSGTFILRSLDEIQSLFDDHIVKTQAMRSSPYIKPFEKRMREWEARLITMQEIIDEWLKCQGVWLYLEPIFSSEDIMRQMPQEAKRFQTVDRLWRKVMAATEARPNVLGATAQEGMLKSWQEANRLLELIQQGLNDYLETKRLAFARLFFLSNDELLQILSETKDPLRVQPHLKKCFEGIAALDFTKELIITGMRSVEKERVAFDTTVDPNAANGMVERWLLEVEGAMKSSICDTCVQAYRAYARSERIKWVLEWPGMVVLVVDQLYWTMETEAALGGRGLAGLKEYEAQCTAQLNDVVALVRRRDLTKLNRATLGAMVTMDVHGRDVLTAMVAAGVDSLNDFNWMSQLRYYYEPKDDEERKVVGNRDIAIRMITAQAKFGLRVPRQLVPPRRHAAHRPLLPHADGRDPAQPRRRARGAGGHREDGDDQGPGEGAREAVRRVQLLRRAGLPGDGQVLQGARRRGRVVVLRRVQPHRPRGAVGDRAADPDDPARRRRRRRPIRLRGDRPRSSTRRARCTSR